jgi:hypothetical protein
VYHSSPKKSDQERTRDKLSDGPELIHSVRTMSFSFSSIRTMSHTASEPRDGESSSFRKEEPEEIVEEPEVVVTSSIRSKPIRGPWDGLVSIFHLQKKDEAHKDEYKKYPFRKEERKEEAVVVGEQKEDEYKKDEQQKEDEPKTRPADSFLPYLSFVQEPYSEASYRALMKPPLGGLAMIISTELKHMDSF